jgi:hypothetical protein
VLEQERSEENGPVFETFGETRYRTLEKLSRNCCSKAYPKRRSRVGLIRNQATEPAVAVPPSVASICSIGVWVRAGSA